MVEFRPSEVGHGGGRPPTVIPAQLEAWLAHTYETGTECQIPASDADADRVTEVVRLARLWCRRQGVSLWYQLDRDNCLLKLRARDKRPYTWRDERRDAS